MTNDAQISTKEQQTTKMPYTKGQSGNPGGRPRAAQTTIEATIEKLESLLCQYLVDNFKLLSKNGP